MLCDNGELCPLVNLQYIGRATHDGSIWIVVSAGSTRYAMWPELVGGWKQQAGGMRSQSYGILRDNMAAFHIA
jgi:hypothetical protein